MKASQIGFTPTQQRLPDTKAADDRLAEIEQEAADQRAANKALHAERIAKLQAERIAHNARTRRHWPGHHARAGVVG